MAEEKDTRDLKPHTNLIEAVEVDGVPGLPNAGKHMKVTIAFQDDRAEPALIATWYISRRLFPDESIVPVARHWLHSLCKKLADDTQEWALSDDQFEQMKRPNARRQAMAPGQAFSTNIPH